MIFLAKDLWAAATCSHEEIELGDAEFKVQTSFYQSRSPNGKTVLIMPPTGGNNALDRAYARGLCSAGFDVYILNRWTGDDEYNLELGIHERLYERTQKAIGFVLAEIPDNRPVGILGTSVGAIFTATAMGVHDRLKAAFVITGGAPIASVIVNSDQLAMKDAKLKRFEEFGFKNEQEYLTALAPMILLDPFKLPRKFEGKKLGMVISEEDTTVPGEYQLSLEKLWNPQTVYRFRNDHFLTILKTWIWHRGDIVRFFQSSLGSGVEGFSNPPPAGSN
ncbi:MAG: hypothetical protein KF789_08180 [Bdellovibrionaceae bacterium]|nr:hypothetical protein [Pseudobdellovibrionaceae bacterium]